MAGAAQPSLMSLGRYEVPRAPANVLSIISLSESRTQLLRNRTYERKEMLPRNMVMSFCVNYRGNIVTLIESLKL